MQLYPKKRITVIVENVFKDKIIELIENSGASGFTLYEGIVGKGQHGVKHDHAGLGEVYGNVEIVTIMGEKVAETFIKGLQNLIDNEIALIVFINDVSVIRDEHFN